uniref:Uncharacterized protein n=1 Tax=Leersia perrieri TaxID=77586 RepID=A0A0D9WWM6_9ORYZ
MEAIRKQVSKLQEQVACQQQVSESLHPNPQSSSSSVAGFCHDDKDPVEILCRRLMADTSEFALVSTPSSRSSTSPAPLYQGAW